jgi:cyclin D1/2/4
MPFRGVVLARKRAVSWLVHCQSQEHAVFDTELTSVSYSALAVACILVAETELKGGHMHASLKTVESLRTVPGLKDLANLSAPVQRLYCLYKSLATSSPSSY